MTSSGIPSYNPGSEESFTGVKPVAPQMVRVAVWLILAAALMKVIETVFGAVNVNSASFKAQLQNELQGKNVAANAVQMGQTFALVSVIVVAVISLVLYVLIAMFINRGMNWARILGTVLAVISLYTLIRLQFPAGIFTILQVILGIVAIVLCFLSASKQYFTASKQYRASRKNL